MYEYRHLLGLSILSAAFDENVELLVFDLLTYFRLVAEVELTGERLKNRRRESEVRREKEIKSFWFISRPIRPTLFSVRLVPAPIPSSSSLI